MYSSKGDWLKAEDLKNKASKVVIAGISVEKFDNGDKIVLDFKGKEKKLVLNKTNADVIADVYGDEELAWIDREIIMYPYDLLSPMVDCLLYLYIHLNHS